MFPRIGSARSYPFIYIVDCPQANVSGPLSRCMICPLLTCLRVDRKRAVLECRGIVPDGQSQRTLGSFKGLNDVDPLLWHWLERKDRR